MMSRADKTDEVRVAALIAVHNRLELTKRCVACLQVNRSPSLHVEIVVVDDGSTDGTAEWLATQPGVTVLTGDGGLWFGGATDLGLRFLLGREGAHDFVLVLNNDTFLRPQGLAQMIAAQTGDNVVAAAYWTEDQGRASSAGFVWNGARGLVNVITTPCWEKRDENIPATLPVDAVATTLVLIPTGLLKRTKLPDATRHPHNRYDAIFSARLRRAGAHFACTAGFMADHRYGEPGNRSSVRKMRLGRFLEESFRNRRSIWHLKGGMALAWETSPSRLAATAAMLRLALRFCRQLAWVSLNSLRVGRPAVAQEVS